MEVFLRYFFEDIKPNSYIHQRDILKVLESDKVIINITNDLSKKKKHFFFLL